MPEGVMRFSTLVLTFAIGFAPTMAASPARAEAVAARAEAGPAAMEAIGLVDAIAAMLQAQGRAATFSAVGDQHGPFRRGNLYAYVMDARDGKLTMLAHGANPTLVGVPQRDIVDADGKTFNDETVALVQNGGTGWVDYRWPNPETHKIARKSSYVRMVEGVIIGVGVYH